MYLLSHVRPKLQLLFLGLCLQLQSRRKKLKGSVKFLTPVKIVDMSKWMMDWTPGGRWWRGRPPNKVRKVCGEGYEAEECNMWRRTNWQLWRLRTGDRVGHWKTDWFIYETCDNAAQNFIVDKQNPTTFIWARICQIQCKLLLIVPQHIGSPFISQCMALLSLQSLTICGGVVGVVARLHFGRSGARIQVSESDLSFSGSIQTVFETSPAYFSIAIGNSFLRNVKRQLC